MCLLCDNQAITQFLVLGTSHCPHSMSLLCCLFLLAAKHNFHILQNTYLPLTISLLTLLLAFACRCSGSIPHRPQPLSPLASLHGQLRHYLQHSLTSFTHSSYSSAQCSFIYYPHVQPYSTLIAPPSQLLRRHSCSLQPSSHPHTNPSPLYLAKVYTLHLEHGLPDPTSEALTLCHFMRGIKRLHQTPVSPLPHLSCAPSTLFSTFPTLII